ncbi:unnamed protein product, partial [Discosporangium mesarthrocarpum]
MDTSKGADEAQSQADQAAQSLKCDDGTALPKDIPNAEFHASKTGHSNFSESTVEVKPLTPEEKAAMVEALKAKLAERRGAREEEEKVDHIKREKARRTMGKEAAK